jgi:hypothetical protein
MMLLTPNLLGLFLHYERFGFGIRQEALAGELEVTIYLGICILSVYKTLDIKHGWTTYCSRKDVRLFSIRN